LAFEMMSVVDCNAYIAKIREPMLYYTSTDMC
jgi:hypothetical protein